MIGFSFKKVEDADFAVKKMDGYKHDDKIWSVQKAPVIFDQEKSRKVEHLQDGYIQIKNLHGFVSDEPLREMFSEFGPIKFCKVMRDSQGQSIGTGFVEFFTPADATRAVKAMNGKVIAVKLKEDSMKALCVYTASVCYIETRKAYSGVALKCQISLRNFDKTRTRQDFQDYTKLCYKEFGDGVKHGIVLNEPLTLSNDGYNMGIHAPGRCFKTIGNCTAGDSGTEPYITAHNLLLSHAAAVKIYKENTS